MSFYAKRVPKYSNHGFVLKVMILLLGIISSVLARYEQLAWVMVATAAATAVTSWAVNLSKTKALLTAFHPSDGVFFAFTPLK